MSPASALHAEYPHAELLVQGQRLRAAIADHYRLLRRVVRRLGVPEFEVDDVLQETFLAFVRKEDAVHARAERQFLLQCAFRVVLARQRGFARRREDLEAAFDEIEVLRPSPEEELSHRQSLEILDGLLAKMPLELRAIFSLCDIEQLSMKEAAAILDVPIGTATSRLRRAREEFSRLAARVRAAEGKEQR
jgi:RNA polymerase sigma-70 factor (ECF subfamily)